MTNKELKRLSRADLLEMMLAVTKENEQLQASVIQMKKRLDDRTVSIENCGSLAEAVLQLNGVFEAAKAACEQYVQNIQERNANQDQYFHQMEESAKQRCEAMIAQAEQQAGEIVAQAERKANEMLTLAKTQADAYLSEAKSRIQKQNSEYSWLTELLDSGEK